MSNEISRVLEECFIDEKRLLEEYREQGLCWRHDDEMFSKLTNILLPLSIGALTLPYLKVGAPKLLAVTGGVMLMTFWFFSSLSYENRFDIRWSRIHEIERILGLDSHLRIDRKRAKTILKGQDLRCWMFIVYLFIASLVTCDIEVKATGTEVRPTNTKVEATLGTIDIWTTPDFWLLDERVIQLVITVETIVAFIIAAAVVGIWVWICKRDDKRSSPENEV